ncbi:LysR family transcriptional regulator [Virgibacillus ainsalahensis]
MTSDMSGEYLRAIIDNGNISSAARALFISQPYLSKFIKNLEMDMGVELINRNVTPVTLTYAGERYLNYMDEIEQTYKNMKHEIEAITNMKKGRVKLGINPILGTHTLYNLLPDFMNRYPGIEIDLIEESAKEIESLLLQRKIDICINMLPVLNLDITYEYLYEESVLLVIPQGHKYYSTDQKTNKLEPFDMQLLDGEDFILLKPGNGLRKVTDEIFEEYSVNPNIILETSNAENAFRLASNGIGLTIIPECITNTSNIQQNQNYFAIGKPAYKYNVVAAYKKGEMLSAPALALLNMAKENYKVIK